MSNFYRFLRPHEFDFKRSQIQCLPHGGICFFIDLGADMKVSYSICPMEELFNREVARRTAKRATSHVIKPNTVSTLDIVNGMLCLPGHDELKLMVALISAKAEQASNHSKIHKEAVEALQLRKRYDELNSEDR